MTPLIHIIIGIGIGVVLLPACRFLIARIRDAQDDRIPLTTERLQMQVRDDQ